MYPGGITFDVYETPPDTRGVATGRLCGAVGGSFLFKTESDSLPPRLQVGAASALS